MLKTTELLNGFFIEGFEQKWLIVDLEQVAYVSFNF